MVDLCTVLSGHTGYWYEVGCYKACLMQSLILHEALKVHGIETKIVAGYYCISPHACKHYWLRTSHDSDIDVSWEILKIHFRRMPRSHHQQTEFDRQVDAVISTPHTIIAEEDFQSTAYTRNDMDDEDERQELARMESFYRAYQKNPVRFWMTMKGKPPPCDRILKGRKWLLALRFT